MTTPAAPTQHQFPCSQCGGALVFDPEKCALICPHCGTEAPVNPPTEAIEELDFNAYCDATPPQESSPEMLTVRCSSCGAETQLASNVTSTRCIFCGSPVVVQEQSQRLIKPRGVLPFAVTRKVAEKDFQDWLASLWFAPSDLISTAQADGLNGVYIPYWTYDADVQTRYTGERGDDYWETETYTEFVNGKPEMRTRQVMKTRWWPVSGDVRNRFDDILVAASASLPPKQTAHLQPWDLAHLIAYADEYLAGFAAESYQVDLRQGFKAAQGIAEPIIRQTVCNSIGGNHQRITSMQRNYYNVTFKHILLPLWISAFSYGGNSYRFLVNARSGQVQGERPYSAWKIAALVVLILAAIATAIALSHR